MLKRSTDVRGFDHALVAGVSAARQTTGVTADVGADRIEVRLPALAVDVSMSIADRASSRGVDPSGRALRYETLLPRGDYSGVAFLIHRESGGAT